jgi:antitoxin component YwqK of YwqJK toxin-antitoxin module
MMYRLLFIITLIFFYSCDQIATSIAKEAGKEAWANDSLQFEYNEKPVATERYDILERKKVGDDSLYLVRGYYVKGDKYYESWQKNNEADGITTFFYPSGKVHYSVLYVDGRANTLLSSFGLNGEKNDAGNLKNGNGVLKIYHPFTGDLIQEIHYRNNVYHVKYLEFYSDGRKKSEHVFKNDSISGPFAKFYHNGIVMEKGDLNLTRGTGFKQLYFSNGKPKQYDEWKDGVQIAYKEFNELGQLVSENKIVDGKYIGTNTYYNSEGILLSKGQLYNNKKHGNYEYFYAGGAKKSLEVYSNDTILSETNWHENGKLSSSSIYKDGLKTGIYKEYYVTGNIKMEQVYVKGVKEGAYKSYFNNGKVYNDGAFKDDELTGELKFYSENGQLKGVKQYPK